MKVIGIDPGSNHTGWSIFVNGNLAAYGKWDFHGNSDDIKNLCRKLRDGYSKMAELISREKPDLVVVESQFIGKKTRETNAVIKLSYFVGGILMAVTHQDIPVIFVTPTEVKEAVTGSGKADKADVREVVNASFGLNLRPKDNDISDAIAIGWMYSDGEAA